MLIPLSPPAPRVVTVGTLLELEPRGGIAELDEHVLVELTMLGGVITDSGTVVHLAAHAVSDHGIVEGHVVASAEWFLSQPRMIELLAAPTDLRSFGETSVEQPPITCRVNPPARTLHLPAQGRRCGLDLARQWRSDGSGRALLRHTKCWCASIEARIPDTMAADYLRTRRELARQEHSSVNASTVASFCERAALHLHAVDQRQRC